VLCLEDAIADSDVPFAERNVVTQLQALHASGVPTPLLFVRVRRAEQVSMLVAELGAAAAVLTGFVFPKFTADTGRDYLSALAEARSNTGLPLYGMPVLETSDVLFAERRLASLLAINSLLAAYPEHVLTVRIGATDLCGLYGLRRSRDLTVYELPLISAAIADIVNVFAREGAYTVSGPVWEYFTNGERLLKPQLRTSPFGRRTDLPHALDVRKQLVRHDMDALLREVVLDKATGIVGKTVIHPSHVRPVHALYVVTAEEYSDACTTLTLADGGVTASAFANKMVESKPHARWATHVLRRAEVFGVLHEDRSFVDLLDVDDVTP
jgi:citrate lyase beta subunit